MSYNFRTSVTSVRNKLQSFLMLLDKATGVIRKQCSKCFGFLKPLSTRIHKRNQTMVGRIMMMYLVWGLIVYVIAVGAIWFTSNKVLEDSFRVQANAWISKLDELSTPLYVSQDAEQFKSIREYVVDFPEIAYVRFYSAENNAVLGEYVDTQFEGLKLPQLMQMNIDELKRISNPEEPYIYHRQNPDTKLARVTAPIWVESIKDDGLLDFSIDENVSKNIKIIGYIDLGLNFSAYQSQLAHSVKFGSLIIAFLFLAAFILGRHLIKKALLPLTRLQEPLAKLADGNHDIRVEVEGDEEIASICNALNTTIAALKERDMALSKLANNDALTGLVNRHSFNQALKAEVDQVAKDATSSALIFIDLDQFKYINDTLGHAVGDRLLAQIAELLCLKTRKDDVVARFGGDEFAIITRNVNEKQAAKVADILIMSMQEFKFIEKGQSYNVYFSAGVALIDSDEYTPEEILSQADMACFSAKSSGRNCYQIYNRDSNDKNIMVADIGWSQKLKHAVSQNTFLLYFQPIINLNDGKPDFYEVLLRMPDVGNEIISPNAFLPSADRFGMASEIDHWVIRNALEELSLLLESDKKASITVNLSSNAFEDEELVSLVDGIIKDIKLPAKNIIFEIGEQAVLNDIDKAFVCITRLNKIGCRFILDDFGSGFSSFNFLKDLPVDFLKIDGSFIVNVVDNPIDQTMVKSMVHIATAIGKKTIATYVEDAETLEVLRDLGVDYAQGFHIGKPARLVTDKAYPVKEVRARNRKIKSVK